MNLVEHILDRLNQWRPVGVGRQHLRESFPESGWSLQITADRVDSVGAMVWELSLSRTNPAPADLTVQAWAEGIAQRTTSLMEPLKLLEVDQTRNEAILRSATPQRRGDDALYYEVRLHGVNEAAVRRYTANLESGTNRDQIAFALTYEAMAKFLGDLAACDPA